MATATKPTSDFIPQGVQSPTHSNIAISTEYDALRLFEACRLGRLPLIRHRLTYYEVENLIRPGAAFVYEQAQGFVRWTDGLLWSDVPNNGVFTLSEEQVHIAQQTESSVKAVPGPRSKYISEARPLLPKPGGLHGQPPIQPTPGGLRRYIYTATVELNTPWRKSYCLVWYTSQSHTRSICQAEHDPILTTISVPRGVYTRFKTSITLPNRESWDEIIYEGSDGVPETPPSPSSRTPQTHAPLPPMALGNLPADGRLPNTRASDTGQNQPFIRLPKPNFRTRKEDNMPASAVRLPPMSDLSAASSSPTPAVFPSSVSLKGSTALPSFQELLSRMEAVKLDDDTPQELLSRMDAVTLDDDAPRDGHTAHGEGQ